MEKGVLFNWLVEYHCSVNLSKSLSKIHNGILDDNNGEYKEGREKGCPYDGILVIANGSTLADRLVEDEVINHEPNEFTDIHSKKQFFDYCLRQSTEDGAYLYDGTREKIAHVWEFNNSPKCLARDFPIYSMIPRDFTSEECSLPLSMIGNKTRLAIKIPHAYSNTEAFQIKRSRYGSLGMGKVTHFTTTGLAREFLFKYHPEYKGQFVNQELGIIGLLRTYQRDGAGTLYRASEEIVDLKDCIYSERT